MAATTLILGILSVISLEPATGIRAGEVDRFELGQRTRAFEAALEKQRDESLRKKAISPLKPVTGLFFTGQLAEVARLLDVARMTLSQGKIPDDKDMFAQSLTVRPEKVLIESREKEVRFSIRRAYPTPDNHPPGTTLRVRIISAKGEVVGGPVVVEADSNSGEGKLQLAKPVEGDYQFAWEVLDPKGKEVASWGQTLSIVTDLEGRLKSLKKWFEQPQVSTTLEGETLARQYRILEALAQGKRLETSFPAARFLKEGEEIVASAREGKPFYQQKKTGEFWLQIPLKKMSVPVRIEIPEVARQGKPLPMVIALHGAGGSDNMFFDAYGNGLIRNLCSAKGWILLAPGNSVPTGELIDAISSLCPVDREKIVVVGHSMGAAMAVQAVQTTPARFRAVACLGGGRGLKGSEELKKVSFFIGCGSEDFALAGARGMESSLKKAEIPTIVFRLYEGLEHLTVVQLALRDVFEFFDRSMNATDKKP